MSSLAGRIAIVAGATRGAGRGIARALGEAGATVYCTGRSVRGKPTSPERPESIEETAEIVTAVGGIGLHARVDHTIEADVEALFARIRSEQGRLDILVNDVWGGDALTEWTKLFWELDLAKGFQLMNQAVRAHIITSRYGVPLMVENNSGLIVEITDGDHVVNRHYRGTLFYDLAKISAIRLALAMSGDLRDHNITALSLTPGFLRSEAMLDNFGVTKENWRDAVKPGNEAFAHSETPTFVGRAVAALAADPYVGEKTGQSLTSWNLAKEYGFVDEDGSRPDIGTFFANEIPDRWKRLVSATR